MKSNPFPFQEDETASKVSPRELDRRTTRLAEERTALFDKAGSSSGLTTRDQERLRSIERELDECFLTRRRQRAQFDARRFDADSLISRRPTPRET
jgi:hypothetical protein